jgi:hypothetical protein
MNTKHLKTLLVPALAAVLMLAASGCDLVSVTVRIVQDVIAPGGTPYHAVSGATEGNIGVDLTNDSDFKDHKDNIKSVDGAGFVFRVQNNLAATATGQIYFSATPINPPSEANIRSQGTLILTGLALPGNAYTNIDYEGSLALQVAANQPLFHETIKSGKIYLYGLAQNAPFDLTIDQLTVILMITAGK